MALMYLFPLCPLQQATFPHVLESSGIPPVPNPTLESEVVQSFCSLLRIPILALEGLLSHTTRRASRGHEAARSEKLLRLLSDRAQTLHNDRTFYSKQSYRFCFFYFNGFWRGNDVTVLKANFQLSLMAQKVYDSERTH